MSQFLFILISLLTTALLPTLAQDTGTEPKEEVPVFESHMIDHPFRGCPGGSQCTKETGLLRQDFSNVLKIRQQRLKNLNHFKSKNGLPLMTWTYPLNSVPKGVALWGSPCPQHNTKTEKIFLAEVMVKNFKSLSGLENFIINKAIIKNDKGAYVHYPMPRTEAPLYMSKNKMIYTLDLDGSYYDIDVDMKGEISVINAKKPERFPENVSCSDEMKEAFLKLEYPDGFFKGVTCKSIWDLDKKGFRSIAYGWSCS